MSKIRNILILIVLQLLLFVSCDFDFEGIEFTFVGSEADVLEVSADQSGLIPLEVANKGKGAISIVEFVSSGKEFVFLADEEGTKLISLPVELQPGEALTVYLYYFDGFYNKDVDLKMKYYFLGHADKALEADLKVATGAKKDIIGYKNSGIEVVAPINKKIDMGEALIGNSTSSKVLLKNVTNSKLRISQLSLTRSVCFSLKNKINTPIFLEKGEVLEDLEIVYTPEKAGYVDDSLYVVTDRGDFLIHLSGIGLLNPNPAMELTLNDRVIYNDQLVEFGLINTEEDNEFKFEVRNVGRSDLKVSNIVFSDDSIFSIDNTEFTLAPNARRNFTITVHPLIEGEVFTSITIISNDYFDKSMGVDLKARAVDANNPLLQLSAENLNVLGDNSYQLAMLSVEPNKTASTMLTFANNGKNKLIIDSIVMKKADVFSINITGITLPITLDYQESIDLPLYFKPTALGDYTDTLQIISNHLGGDDVLTELDLIASCTEIRPLLPPVVEQVNLQTDKTPHYRLESRNVEFKVSTAEGSLGCGNYRYSVFDGSVYQIENVSFALESNSWINIEIPISSDGVYTLEVEERDQSENWSSKTSYTFEVAAAIPEKPTISIQAKISTYDEVFTGGVHYTNNPKPVWSWLPADENNAVSYKYKLDGGTESNTNEKVFEPGSNLSDGEHTLTVSTVDKFGRTGHQASAKITVDRTGPVISLTGAASITQEVHKFGTYTDHGYSASDAGVGVDTTTLVKIESPSTCTGQDVGTYTLTYKISDRLGNVSQVSATRTIIIEDTTAPVIDVASNLKTTGIDINFRDKAFNMKNFITNSANGVEFDDNSKDTFANDRLSLVFGTPLDVYKSGPQKVYFAVKDYSGNYTGWDYIVANIQEPSELHGGGANILTDASFEDGVVKDDSDYGNYLSSAWTVEPLDSSAYYNYGWGNKSYFHSNVDAVDRATPQGPVYFIGNTDLRQRIMAGVVSATPGIRAMWHQSKNCPFAKSASDDPIPARSGDKSYLIKNAEKEDDNKYKYNGNDYMSGVSVRITNKVALQKGFKYRAKIHYISGDGRGGTGTAEGWGYRYSLQVGLYDNLNPLTTNYIPSPINRSWASLDTPAGSPGLATADKEHNFSVTNYANMGAATPGNIYHAYFYAFMQYDDAEVWCVDWDKHPAIGSQNPPAQSPANF